MKNLIHKLLSEELGIQKHVHELSNYVFGKIENTSIGKNQTIEKILEVPLTIKNDLQIDYIKLTISNSDKNGGSFILNDTKIVNGFYRIHINLTIDFTDILLLKSIISHELNHTYVYLKKYKKKQKTLKYNQVIHMLKHEFNQYGPLKEFIYLLYLNLPEEIQARVQETQVILDDIEFQDYNDTIKELYKYQPINDAVRMSGHNIDDIMKLNKNTLQDFVNTFNLNKNYQGLGGSPITNIHQFFKYWSNFIKKGGVKLNKKILKLVARKYNKNEELFYDGLYTELLSEIFIGNYYE